MSYQQKQQEKEAVAKQALETEQAKQAKLSADKKSLESEKIAELTAPKTQEPAVKTPACELNTTMYVTVREGHALRSEKSLTAAKVVTAPYGAAIKVGCKDGAWYKARYADKDAYAYAEYLSSTKPAAEVAVKADMTQEKCTSVKTLYTAKDPTPIYVIKEGKAVSANQSVQKGKDLSKGECAMWNGAYVSGYWIYDATVYSFSDLSTTKP
jgi:hypothetical protein